MQDLADLYQGSFLADVSFRDAARLEEWISNTQRHLHELYTRLLYEIVELAYQQSNYEIGLRYAPKLVELDPLWDVAQRQLMRLFAATNRTNKALFQYKRFESDLKAELEVTPDEETVELYEQIKSHRFETHQQTGRSSIILPDTPFVQPSDDIAIAQRMLNTPNCRLLTIFGMSGIGKTTLATQLAYYRQHRYRDGACFISLSTAQTADDLLHRIATALNINASRSMDRDTLSHLILEHVHDHELLLILDNYEQLLPETDFVEELLQKADNIQIVVTSQAPLNVYREWSLPMRGLQLPSPDDENPQSYEAVRLFEIVARRSNSHFDLSESLQEVIQICQLVESLPLGIIIAAEWVQYLSPKEVLTKMQNNLLEMESIQHDIPSRHQSFQKLINSMLRNLSAEEQEALICLSIFEGSFTYEAAIAIADISTEDFKNLTDKHLLQHTDGYRYTLHSLVHQAFRSQLEQSLLDTVAMRYLDYFKGWCDNLYTQHLPLQELMRVIDVEEHNLWQVNGLTTSQQQEFLMSIAPVMNEYWINRDYHARGIIDLLQSATENKEIPPQRQVYGLITLACLYQRTSQHDHAWEVCEQILALGGEYDLPYVQARALRVLSEICAIQAKFEQATDYLQSIIEMESQVSIDVDPRILHMIALAYEDLGEILLSQGKYDQARHYINIAIERWNKKEETLRECIALSYLGIIMLKEQSYDDALDLYTNILPHAQKANNQTLIAIFSSYLGIATMHSGDYLSACELFQTALKIAIHIDRKTTMINTVEQFVQLSLYMDSFDLGTQLLGFAECMRDQLHLPLMPHYQDEYDDRKDQLKRHLDDNFDQNFQIGCKMGLSTALQLISTLVDSVKSLSVLSQ